MYLCESGYRGHITRKGPMMGAGKALREKHRRVIQHKSEEYGRWHVRSRWFQWEWDTEVRERRGLAPGQNNLESLQRNQEQGTPVSEWCCQEVVNTKSAGCAASCLGPDSGHWWYQNVAVLTAESVWVWPLTWKTKVLNCASGQVHAGLPASSLTSGIFQLHPDTVWGRADLF